MIVDDYGMDEGGCGRNEQSATEAIVSEIAVFGSNLAHSISKTDNVPSVFDSAWGLMAMTTSASGFHKSARFRLALAVGCLIAFSNLVLMFRGWVVAPQAEVIGANILFLFLGLVPWIGLIASGCGRPVGPWILTISPVLALTGLFFTNNQEWMRMLVVMLITAAPALAIGLVLLRLSRKHPVGATT